MTPSEALEAMQAAIEDGDPEAAFHRATTLAAICRAWADAAYPTRRKWRRRRWRVKKPAPQLPAREPTDADIDAMHACRECGQPRPRD